MADKNDRTKTWLGVGLSVFVIMVLVILITSGYITFNFGIGG